MISFDTFIPDVLFFAMEVTTGLPGITLMELINSGDDDTFWPALADDAVGFVVLHDTIANVANTNTNQFFNGYIL